MFIQSNHKIPPYTLSVSNNDQNHSNTSAGQYGNHIVKAQLPNQQRTTVSIPTGMTIREALSKALKLRKLEPDMCTVFRLSPHSQAKQQIDWDVEVAMLKGDEILVETKDRIPMHTQLSHNFGKIFWSLSKCHFCQELLLSGIKCLTCGIEFHKNCSSSVPKLCEPAIEHNNYYRHLLARSSGFSPTSTLSTSESPTNSTRPIRPRARSADENSKHKSKSNNNTSNQTNDPNSANYKNGAQNDHSQHQNEPQLSSNIQHNQAHHLTSNGLPSANHLQPNYNSNMHSVFNIGGGPSIGIHHSGGQPSDQQHHHLSHLQQPSTPKDHDLSALMTQLQMSPNQQQAPSRQLLEEKWEIGWDEFDPKKELIRIGQGSFATVYMGEWHGPVALKKLHVKDPTPAQLQDFKNEVVVLKKTRHANVLLFVGYVLKPELIIVTQWCKGRSLYKHLHAEDVREFNNSEIKKIAIGVAQGMEYLHAKNIIHRDLKSNNIFIHDEDDLTVKIGDFGLATFKTRWEGDQQIYHPTGSILWMAPEVVRTKPGQPNPFTFQSDVYSYGIVLYELLSRKLPYFDFKHKDGLLFLIGLGGERSPKLNLDVIPRDKPEGLKTLMLCCTEREPLKRPLFTSIVKDLKKIRLDSGIPRSTSEPLRLNDLDNGSLTINY